MDATGENGTLVFAMRLRLEAAHRLLQPRLRAALGIVRRRAGRLQATYDEVVLDLQDAHREGQHQAARGIRVDPQRGRDPGTGRHGPGDHAQPQDHGEELIRITLVEGGKVCVEEVDCLALRAMPQALRPRCVGDAELKLRHTLALHHPGVVFAEGDACRAALDELRDPGRCALGRFHRSGHHQERIEAARGDAVVVQEQALDAAVVADAQSNVRIEGAERRHCN